MTRAFRRVSPGDIARIEHEANAKTITPTPQVVHSAVKPLPLCLHSPDHPPQPLSHPVAILTYSPCALARLQERRRPRPHPEASQGQYGAGKIASSSLAVYR